MKNLNSLNVSVHGGGGICRERRAGATVGIFPNEEAIIRLIGAVLLEANDDWQLQHRYMQIDGMAELTVPLTDLMQIPPQAV